MLLVCGASCEKNIAITLHPSTTNLVVDASIESGSYPVVILSTSLAYFSQIDPATLSNSFVHQATVYLSNGTVTGLLKEDSLDLNGSGFKLYYYSFNAGDTGVQFIGDFHSTYSLDIGVAGVHYLATTHISSVNKKIDSLWWQPAPPGNDSNDVVIKARITDPAGYGDYTRYFTSVDGGSFYPGLTSVFDDQITDGTTYDVQVDRGVDRNVSNSISDYSYFKNGDTVTVKYCNIDKATYDFWRTMEYNYQSIGNPFSTPIKVLGNVSNNALGYFGGYAVQYVNLVIPK